MLESEEDPIYPENLERSSTKYTQKAKSKTDLDRQIEEPMESDDPGNDLPFRDMPEWDLLATSYTVLCEPTQNLPKGSIIASDPVLQYLNALPMDDRLKPIFMVA